ncbi:MAG: hypothetical protein IIA45_09130 [Bacteroidetes bacterium]|nr:hypothetical protein [Bacteroidota bacterium]
MVLANLHTMSGDRLLESGGMVNITAKSGNEELKLRKGSRMNITFPATIQRVDFKLFAGKIKNNEMDWEEVKSDEELQGDAQLAETSFESTRIVRRNRRWGAFELIDYKDYSRAARTIDTYIFSSSRLGWINCDRFVATANNNTIVNVKIEDSSETIVRMVFKNINSIIPDNNSDGNQAQFVNVPIGEEVLILAFSVKEGIPRFGSIDMIVKKDMELILDLQVSSPEQIKQILKDNLN